MVRVKIALPIIHHLVRCFYMRFDRALIDADEVEEIVER